jgi:hypothetical protein
MIGPGGASARRLIGLAIALAVIPLAIAATRNSAVVALPIVFAGAFAVVRRPNLAIYLVILVLYTNAAVVAVKFQNAPAIVAAAVPLMLVAPLANQFIVKRGHLIAPPAFIPLVAYLLVQLASAGVSVDPNSSTDEIVTFLLEGFVLFLLVCTVVQSRRVLVAAMWTIVIGGGILGALSVYQQATGTFSNNYFGFAQLTSAEFRTGDETLQGDVFQPRLAGPIGDQNFYAQILAVGLPMTLALIRIDRRVWTRAIAIGAAIAIAAGVALTFSRGAIVGLGIALVVATLMGVIRRREVVLLVVAGAAFAVLVFPDLLIRLATLDPSTGADDPSIQSRTTENAAAALAFLDHPILGVGPGLFPDYYQTYAHEVGVGLHASTRQAHNLYLGLAAETGIAGVLTFGAVLYVTVRSLLDARRRVGDEIELIATALLLSLIVFLSTSLFLHLAYERYFWLLLALAAAAGVVGREGLPVAKTKSRPGLSTQPAPA